MIWSHPQSKKETCWSEKETRWRFSVTKSWRWNLKCDWKSLFNLVAQRAVPNKFDEPTTWNNRSCILGIGDTTKCGSFLSHTFFLRWCYAQTFYDNWKKEQNNARGVVTQRAPWHLLSWVQRRRGGPFQVEGLETAEYMQTHRSPDNSIMETRNVTVMIWGGYD